MEVLRNRKQVVKSAMSNSGLVPMMKLPERFVLPSHVNFTAPIMFSKRNFVDRKTKHTHIAMHQIALVVHIGGLIAFQLREAQPAVQTANLIRGELTNDC